MARDIDGINIGRLAKWAIFGLVFLVLFFGAVYTVEEGHVGIIKRFSKAIAQVDPGLHVKFPFVDGIEEIEVRQRKNVEELSSSTQNQLPIAATVSILWTVDKATALDLFIQYGGLTQFESRILDPKLRSAAKAALAKFPADQLIRNRQLAVAAIMEEMVESLKTFPVVVNSPQIENIKFPVAYMAAVQAKEQARENAEKEKHNLERQRLESLQEVNTAEASASAKRLGADAEAYKLITESTARAEAIKMLSAQLKANPLYIDYIKAQRWDGAVPKTVLGDGGNVLFSVK